MFERYSGAIESARREREGPEQIVKVPHKQGVPLYGREGPIYGFIKLPVKKVLSISAPGQGPMLGNVYSQSGARLFSSRICLSAVAFFIPGVVFVLVVTYLAPVR